MKRILRKIVQELARNEDVRTVILYGSFARGEDTSRSDIDLFIVTTKKRSQDTIQNTIINLELEIDRSIQPTIRTVDELRKTDTGLLQNVFQEGKILYLKEPTDMPVSLLLRQKPFLIYTFQISSLSQKEKARFNRYLYERTRRGYKYKGFLQEIAGQKLSPGCVIIPYIYKNRITRVFKKYKIKYKYLKVWK